MESCRQLFKVIAINIGLLFRGHGVVATIALQILCCL